MTEETFFAALRDHLPDYTLKITYNVLSPSGFYAVELFTRKTTWRSHGLILCNVFENLLHALRLEPNPTISNLSETRKTP